MKKYIAPAIDIEAIEAEQMMALSLLEGEADGSEVLVNEEKQSESTTSTIWDKEW